jgi:hypothetical protein
LSLLLPHAHRLWKKSVCRTAAEAAGLPLKLRRQSGSSSAGSLAAGSPAQLLGYNPFLTNVTVHGLQRVKAKVPFSQFFLTIAEISPTTSLYLLWKCQRRQTQSLWFIISSEAHIAFGLDIRYNII